MRYCLFDAPVASTILSSSPSSAKDGALLLMPLDGHVEPKQQEQQHSTLAETVACVEKCPTIADALAVISKGTNVPLLFTQKEACREGKEGKRRIIFSRSTNVARARRGAEKRREYYRTPTSRNFFNHGGEDDHYYDERASKGGGKGGKGKGKGKKEAGKGGKGGKGKKGYHNHQSQRQSQPASPLLLKPALGGGCGKGLKHRGTAERAPHVYFDNAAREEDQGTVLRSGTVVAAGPVGFVTAMTTQPLLHGVSDGGGGVCFSNEPRLLYTTDAADETSTV